MHVRRAIRSLVPVLLAACATACGDEPDAMPPGAAEARAREPVALAVGEVEAGRLPRVVHATGTLEPDDVVTVAAEVAGRIVAVSQDVGGVVSPGDPLAQVDDANHVLERDRRRRALSEALAKLGLTELPSGEMDFERLPTVERARLEAANAKAKLDRVQTLRDRTPPLVSEQDFADVRTAWEVAESARRTALLDAQTDLAAARTRRAELDAAEKTLRDTRHVVPSGDRPRSDDAGPQRYLVAERLVAVGDRVNVGAPLFRLVDADPLRLTVQVPERKMAGVQVGSSAKVATASGPPVNARVARIRPEVDLRTRTVDVQIDVENGDLRFAAGAFATAQIEVGVDEGVPLVPASAVRRFAGVQKVFAIADGKTVEKVVQVGRTVADKLEITSGLRVGEAIVLAPPQGLVTGTPARAVAPPESPK